LRVPPVQPSVAWRGCWRHESVFIDLPTALRLAGAQNLTRESRERLVEANNNDSAMLQFFRG
jgi:hypothetical protein